MKEVVAYMDVQGKEKKEEELRRDMARILKLTKEGLAPEGGSMIQK